MKLPLLIAGLLTAALVVSVGLAYRLASRTALDAAEARLESVAAQFASLLARDLAGGVEDMRSGARDSAVVRYLAGVPGSEAAARDVLRALPGDTALDLATEIRGASGEVLLSARPLTAEDSAVAAAAPARRDTTAVSGFFVHDGRVYYEVMAPIATPGGERGQLVIRQQLGGTGLRRLPGVIGTEAKLLLGNPDGGAWVDFVRAPRGPVEPVPASGAYQRDGAARLGARTGVPGTPWVLAAEFPRSAALSDARSLARDIVLVALAVLAIGTGLGWAMSRRLTRPLRELTAGAEAMARPAAEAHPAARSGDEIQRLAGAFGTMVERVQDGEARLRASEAQYRLLFDLNPSPMWVFDRETLAFLAVNDVAVQKYGWTREEFLRMTIADIRPPEDVARLHEALRAGPSDGVAGPVWRHVTRDGKRLDVEIVGRPLTFGSREAELVLVRDVTERRLLEEQLRQSQKMEAIGRLAGGVAHDFNNILTVIHSASEFLVHDLDAADPRRNDAVEIRAAAERATALTRQLLAFSRRQVFELQVLDLNQVVRPLEPLLRRVVEANITLVTRLEPDLGMIVADPSQIDQVILNLVVNARDAMPSGGTIVIETSNVVLDENYPRSHLLERLGPHVVLTVTDTGVGMDPLTQASIFEPFFTTKPVGKGTGLGLATVYGIVKQLGGHIWVYSEVGRGTTFKIYFHQHEGVPSGADVPLLDAGGRDITGTTILLVEDDPAVRAAIRRVLARRGFAVVEAETGEAALRILESGARRVGLVLSDLVMPGMGGLELRRRLGALDGGLPLLLMSGYSAEAIATLENHEELGPLLEKPFTVERLLQKIAEALATAEMP